MQMTKHVQELFYPQARRTVCLPKTRIPPTAQAKSWGRSSGRPRYDSRGSLLGGGTCWPARKKKGGEATRMVSSWDGRRSVKLWGRKIVDGVQCWETRNSESLLQIHLF